MDRMQELSLIHICITLSDFWGNSIEVSGSKLEKYISSRKDVEYEVHDDGLYITALTQEDVYKRQVTKKKTTCMIRAPTKIPIAHTDN